MSTQTGAKAQRRPSAGASLLQAVRALDGPILVERSAKLLDGKLNEGRFLVSVPKSALYPGPNKKLKRICSDHGIPSAGYDMLEPHLRAASSVHFGFEPEYKGDRVKCYLEFSTDTPPRAGLVFLAVKWICSPNGADVPFAMTRYWSRSTLSQVQKERLAATILPCGAVREAAHSLLELARDAEESGVATFLEVEEPHNPRRSLDINLANARMTLSQLGDLLAPIFSESAAAPSFEALLAREGEAVLGHFAAGLARTGTPFVTLYYGAEYG